MKELFFDLETTGLDEKRNAIHQLSGIIRVDGKIVEEFDINMRPDPDQEVKEQALKVSNLTVEDVINNELSQKEGYEQFVSMLDKYVDRFNKKDKIFLCGYNNVKFDNEFLRELFNRNGDKYFGSWFWSGGIDLMILALEKLRHKRAEMDNFKLMTVAKELGIVLNESKLHNAVYDIELTIEICDRLRNMQ
jgi:DNA polymerase-3 subunit epsilon